MCILCRKTRGSFLTIRRSRSSGVHNISSWPSFTISVRIQRPCHYRHPLKKRKIQDIPELRAYRVLLRLLFLDMFTDTEVNEGLFTLLCTQDIDDQLPEKSSKIRTPACTTCHPFRDFMRLKQNDPWLTSVHVPNAFHSPDMSS